MLIFKKRGNETMNEEEMSRRIEKLEEEIDTVKFSLRALERILEALHGLMERWNKSRTK
jgi:predicted  nucleic acid-binding Zn-ribbon protein